MKLIWQVNEWLEREEDFLDALRQCEACNFTSDKDQEQALHELKEDLHRIDDQLRRLIELRPELEATYREQHLETQNQIARRILKLKLYGVSVCHPLAPPAVFARSVGELRRKVGG